MDELNKVYQLNEYLKELEEGELGLERVTEPEIASLLKLAEHLQKNLPVASSPRFRQQAKENTLAAWQKRRLYQRRRLAKIIALAAAFLLLLSSLASAAWRSKPGSLLYPVKEAIKRVITFVSGNQESKRSLKPRPENKENQNKKISPEDKKQKKKPENKSEKKTTPNVPQKKNIRPNHSQPSSNRLLIEKPKENEEPRDASNPSKENSEERRKSEEQEKAREFQEKEESAEEN